MSLNIRTEDEVRDGFTPTDGSDFVNGAKQLLGFDQPEKDVLQGTGQIKTFNQLGFKGINDKPDGWYLPKDSKSVAIILETKAESEDLYNQIWEQELFKNIDVISVKYKKIVGILYNGKQVRVFKNKDEIPSAPELQNKQYYISLFDENNIDKKRIYTLTKQINDCLHVKFGVKDLYHRMIFTACALVACRYGATLTKGMRFETMKTEILSTLNKSIEKSVQQNIKLGLLTEVYAEIKMNCSTNQEAIDNFIDWVKEISECVNSIHWNGEDVMGIFFNEFNRYKAKSDNGQIFTPDHITSFMYRLIHVNQNDYVLDAACGSGAFLVKAMCNMMKESGGINTKKAKSIKSNQLYGIEFDKQIYALACANMLIHKDGKTNLENMDTRLASACSWIESKKITKVLMNPPFERKYGCLDIVQNVLDHVPEHTECAFILPDKKLEKDKKHKKFGNKLLEKHTLKKIIKLSEKTFREGVTTSIFIFEAKVPHNGKDIFACYIKEDGLETVKNQGRQDIRNKWQEIEDKWVKIIDYPMCKEADEVRDYIQIINPKEFLSYQKPVPKFAIYEEDFLKSMMEYEMFKQGIDPKQFNENILNKVIQSSRILSNESVIDIVIGKKNDN